jgi:hypothetical protein
MPSACPLGYPTAKLIFDKKKYYKVNLHGANGKERILNK